MRLSQCVVFLTVDCTLLSSANKSSDKNRKGACADMFKKRGFSIFDFRCFDVRCFGASMLRCFYSWCSGAALELFRESNFWIQIIQIPLNCEAVCLKEGSQAAAPQTPGA